MIKSKFRSDILLQVLLTWLKLEAMIGCLLQRAWLASESQAPAGQAFEVQMPIVWFPFSRTSGARPRTPSRQPIMTYLHPAGLVGRDAANQSAPE